MIRKQNSKQKKNYLDVIIEYEGKESHNLAMTGSRERKKKQQYFSTILNVTDINVKC